MIKTIKFKGKSYPHFQAEGNATQFALPYAKHVCKGIGFDIGYNKEEWKFPDAIGVDIKDSDGIWDALHLPEYYCIDKNSIKYPSLKVVPKEIKPIPIKKPEYIYSSHCLEHLPNWVEVLDYWMTSLRDRGTLFLYLPDYSQVYWRPYNNRKHVHTFTPKIMQDYFESRADIDNIFISEIDLNNSFMVMIEKL